MKEFTEVPRAFCRQDIRRMDDSERSVAGLLASGYPVLEVAKLLHCSEASVRRFSSRARQKTDSPTVVSLVAGYWAKGETAAEKLGVETNADHIEAMKKLSPDIFTDTERRIMRLTGLGMPIATIAGVCGISTHTVRSHFDHIYPKLSPYDPADPTQICIPRQKTSIVIAAHVVLDKL
jgi:DNA-binding CsgD family transcriptional regulator